MFDFQEKTFLRNTSEAADLLIKPNFKNPLILYFNPFLINVFIILYAPDKFVASITFNQLLQPLSVPLINVFHLFSNLSNKDMC